MPTSPLPASTSASPQQSQQDEQEDEDLAQLGRWLERHPHLLEKWLKEQASQEVKQRVQQAVLPVGEERSLRNSEISSDVFQLWLAASPANNNTKQIQNVRPDRDYDSMECQVSHKLFYILVIYVPPAIPLATVSDFYESLMQIECIHNRDIIIMGDFNIPKFVDNNLDDGATATITDFMNFLNLRQYNTVLNSLNRLLDLVMSNVECNVVRDVSPAVKEDDYHPALLILPKVFYKKQKIFTRGAGNLLYNFRRANFHGLYDAILHTDWSFLSHFFDVDAAVQVFYDKLYEILDMYVPKSKVMKRQFPFWYTSNIIKNIKLKEKCLSRYKVSRKMWLDDRLLASPLEIVNGFATYFESMFCAPSESTTDARFNSEIDMRMDYRTNAVLCMPIFNYEGDVIGVAQIVNKRPAGEFDAHDAELFQRYLTFCGIGVQNAQLFEVSVLEYKRNQILLNLARSIFEEQNNLECLVSKIMREAQDLLKCERCAVYLLDLDCCEAIAGYAACTGQILNIGDVRAWLKEQHSEGDAESARTILCMPIINGQRTIIECDVSLFEAFAIFCGLGIHNTQMYENACKLMAKQKEHIPSAQTYNLYSFTFVDFDLSDMDTCKATVRMFLECSLVQQFHIPYEVLCRWILSVKKNYRPVKYHNWRHALNVAQTMFAMFKTGKMERFMSDLEILGLLVACLCHDLDHRGTNNAFQMKTDSPLAVLYSTSTMEHHHFDQCVMILNTDTNNIFQALSPDDYRTVMKMVENAILSTDLAMYFKKKNKFLELIDNGEFDWQSEDKKELLSGMMMTACDVSAIAKPWEVQHKIAKLVADEFFEQGDLEKIQLKEQPIMQVGFIDVICLPLYRVLSDTFPWMRPLYLGTLENRKHWQDLAEKVEMGLTWIDHDTIDKPVEAFRDAEETKDIELIVTTFKTVSNAPTVDIKKRTKHKICCVL
nr:unnamed protein product [Callosobruchus chinensis]